MIVPKERKPVPPSPIELEKLLLVEGDTPSHLMEALAKELHLEKSIEIRNYGGIKDLSTFLRTIAASPGFREKVRSLGIVRDAEEDPVAARMSVESAIAKAKFSQGVSTKIAILPDERSKGMIETLCLRSVESNPVMGCIEDFIKCASDQGAAIPDVLSRDKNRAQIYMAVCGQAQMMPGLASYKGVWRFDHPSFEFLRNFLATL